MSFPSPSNMNSHSLYPFDKPSTRGFQTTHLQSLLRHKSSNSTNKLPPQIKPKPIPKTIPRCFKYQGYGHTFAYYTNIRVITLAEWEAMEDLWWKNIKKKKRRASRKLLNKPAREVVNGKKFVIGLQTIEEESQEDPYPTKEETTLSLIPLPPLKFSQPSPKKNLI